MLRGEGGMEGEKGWDVSDLPDDEGLQSVG